MQFLNRPKHWLQRQFLYLATGLCRLAVRAYGWSDKPKPVQYPPSARTPYWRYVSERHIESTDLAGAIRASFHAASKK